MDLELEYTHPYVLSLFLWYSTFDELLICSHPGISLQFVAVWSFPILLLVLVSPLLSLLCFLLIPKASSIKQQKTPENKQPSPEIVLQHMGLLWSVRTAKAKGRRGHCSQERGKWAHCFQQQQAVVSAVQEAQGFSGILKFNQPASKSLLTIINNTRSRGELQETGKPKTCAWNGSRSWHLGLSLRQEE